MGAEYVVLSIHCQPERAVELLLDLGDEQFSWWQSIAFTTLDPRHPPNWVTRIEEMGIVNTGPESWLEQGFWNDFFDGDERARAIYYSERAVMLDSDSTS
ncbi:hypothetical protein [Actinoplanes sp. NPDC089786]|uniref:hypothetical protein n=1 Tax=Actinoplanes sp. NPDC089786 TaxID=3155185 RepID=UPI003445D6B0